MLTSVRDIGSGQVSGQGRHRVICGNRMYMVLGIRVSNCHLTRSRVTPSVPHHCHTAQINESGDAINAGGNASRHPAADNQAVSPT